MLFAFVKFSFLSTMPTVWLGRTSPKWPILCRVWDVTSGLNQSISGPSSTYYANLTKNDLYVLSYSGHEQTNTCGWKHYLLQAVEEIKLQWSVSSDLVRFFWASRFLANVNSRSRSLYAVARPSVCLSVTIVRPTQAVHIFDNVSMALGTLAIRWHPLKILWRSSKGNPSAEGVKHKRGSKI